jgi:hypothetical protein
MNTDEFITELGLENLNPDQQQRVIDDLNMRVGEAVTADLSDEQVIEYEAIINGNQAIITAWLRENAPHYATTVAYQQLAEGYEDDPEKIPADKIYASMAWIEKNNPNLSETVASIKDSIKENIQHYM